MKQYLTVTATYSDSTTRVLAANEYTLSGTLAYPSATVTAECQGESDTFYVVVAYDAAVEYIEGTGTQYINTGIPTNGVDRVTGSVEFTYLSASMRVVVGGRQGSTSGTAYEYAVYSSSHGGFTFYPGAWKDSASVAVNVGQKLTFDATIKDGHQQFSVDGIVTYTGTSGITITSGTNTIHVFALVAGGNTQYPTIGKVFAPLNFYFADELIMSLVPVRCGQVGYMYDRVSGHLFANAGTGDFVVGADV